MFIHFSAFIVSRNAKFKYSIVEPQPPYVIEMEELAEEEDLFRELFEEQEELSALDEYRNAVQNANDKREISETDFGYTQSQARAAAQARVRDYIKDQENKYGKDPVEKIPDWGNDRKDDLDGKGEERPGKPSPNKAGLADVTWNVPGRKNPSFSVKPNDLCRYGGRITFEVQVSNTGVVKVVKVHGGGGNGACALREARTHVSSFRFPYDTQGPKKVSGIITYVFHSQ